MPHFLAAIACLGITGLYLLIALALGWKNGGGFIPLAIVFFVDVWVWRRIVASEGKPQVKA